LTVGLDKLALFELDSITRNIDFVGFLLESSNLTVFCWYGATDQLIDVSGVGRLHFSRRKWVCSCRSSQERKGSNEFHSMGMRCVSGRKKVGIDQGVLARVSGKQCRQSGE
jgi:hypothetical protein